MIGCIKCFDNIKSMSFKVIDKELWKSHIKIWERISILIGKEFDNEPVSRDNDKYIKTKIKPHGNIVNRDSQVKKYQKKMHHTRTCHWWC